MNRPVLALLVLAALLAAACGEKKTTAPKAGSSRRQGRPPHRPLQRRPPPRPRSPTPRSASAIRSRASWATCAPATGAVVTRCNTPLGRFELDQLRLVAVITGLADPLAMVEAPTGVGYSVRKGACIGKNGGVVATIRTGEVVVTEWAMRADGTREKTETALRLPKEQSLNLEE